MTDLAVRPNDTQAVSLVRQTALDLAAAAQIGKAIAATSFAPAHFRGKPEECAVAILYGATVNLDPITAIQQIYVIGGKPALYARAMVAIVLSQGHDIWTETEEPGRVVVAGRRKGSDKVERIEWNIDLARQAGYLTNKKYVTDPRSMLYARASGDVARRIAPDALMGMTYNVEELELGEVAVTVHDGPAPATTGPVTAAEIMGELEAAPAGDAPGPITRDQLAALGRALRDAGLDDKDEALATVADIVGHDVTGTRELTTAEGQTVIDTLTAMAARLPAAAPAPNEPPADLLAVDEAWGIPADGAA